MALMWIVLQTTCFVYIRIHGDPEQPLLL